MSGISNLRLSPPKAGNGEIMRKVPLSAFLDSGKKPFYIHAGAGYGKTTLLSQIANFNKNTVWLTLAFENDALTFADDLSDAIRRRFPDYCFNASEYLLFEDNSNFITHLANAIITGIAELSKDFVIILDDLHTIKEPAIIKLLCYLIQHQPENTRFCLGSREAPWQDLMPSGTGDSLSVITQEDLAFTSYEAAEILGFEDDQIHDVTGGWPLAVGAYKVLLESGLSHADFPSLANEKLCSHLFSECLSRLPQEMVDFLKASACFEELDTRMLAAVLNIKHVKLLLESLVMRNIFTFKIEDGLYSYHSLFREYLLKTVEARDIVLLQNKAIQYYYEKKEYPEAARCALLIKNKEAIRKIILERYRKYIRDGSFIEIRAWFHAFGDAADPADRDIIAAKGIFLASIGSFNEAGVQLDSAIPLLDPEDDKELFVEVMLNKARVLRNTISFSASNRLLDELLSKVGAMGSETTYSVVVEKLYNLCWNSQIKVARDIAEQMTAICEGDGNLKVKAWYERYLCVISFFEGRMKDSVRYYEKSLMLPEDEQQYLHFHRVGIYAAMAYQMAGEENKALSVIASELQSIGTSGRSEDMWAGCLIAAEIYYQKALADQMNGGSQTFDTAIQYLKLSDEYSLRNKTGFQMQWVKMQRLAFDLILTDGPKERAVNEIFANLDQSGDYLKIAMLGRLSSWFYSLTDITNAALCAKQCIKIGERAGLMLFPTLAYGILAGTSISIKDKPQANIMVSNYLRLCSENGIYDQFRMLKAYVPILEFAYYNEIEPFFTKQMLKLAGYKTKKAYIRTLGGFSVFSFNDRQDPIKMRTKRERELLAYIIDAGENGATKDQIRNALLSDSKSEDIKKLIGVNLAHIRKDLASLGIGNPIVNREKHYTVCKDEIVTDIDLYESAMEEFRIQNNKETAQKLVSLYNGDYLAGFEKDWAMSRRIRYRTAYEKAFLFLSECSGA